MAIDDLRRRIFQKEEDFSKRYDKSPLQKHKEQSQVSWSDEKKNITPPSPQMQQEQKNSHRIILWGLVGGLFVIVGLVVFFLLPGGFTVGNDTLKHINFRVEGGEKVSAGKSVTWKVLYKNDNQTSLENATITFEFPETSQPLVGEFSKTGLKREKRELGTLAPNVQGEEIFSAIVFGAKDSVLKGKTYLEYRPESTSARLSKNTEYESKVTESLLGIAIEMPENLQKGQETDIKFHVTSNAEIVFKGLSLQVAYPEGFDFISTNPSAARANNIWLIGDIAPNSEYVVTVRGKVKQVVGPQTFYVDVGLYDRIENKFGAVFASASDSFDVPESLLALSFSSKDGEIAPGIIQLGKLLRVSVDWKNNLPVVVHNVNIEVAVDGSVLDLTTLQSKGGEVQINSNTLKWLAARIPALSSVDPGESGQFSFDVQLKKEVPIKTGADKNFLVYISGRISGPEGALGYEGVDISGKSEKEYKVASRVVFTQKGYFNDSRIKNSGPLPPRVGEETTYTVVWSLLNTINDIDGVEVRATVPSYIRWANVIMPQDPALSFNESTRELVWRPDKISAGTGFVRPAREVAFQVGLTPSLSQVGDSPELISAATMNARDIFTGVTFQPIKVGLVASNVPDDPLAQRLGKVVQ
ncbi:MAG: hypothetical protein AAB482_03835 [Patescibacteria group bacterium]